MTETKEAYIVSVEVTESCVTAALCPACGAEVGTYAPGPRGELCVVLGGALVEYVAAYCVKCGSRWYHDSSHATFGRAMERRRRWALTK